jgi:hypothetical protein
MLSERARFWHVFSEIPARTGFEPRTDVCQHDIDKYWRISWLPFLDTYRTMCVAPTPDFLRVLEEVRETLFAP